MNKSVYGSTIMEDLLSYFYVNMQKEFYFSFEKLLQT